MTDDELKKLTQAPFKRWQGGRFLFEASPRRQDERKRFAEALARQNVSPITVELLDDLIVILRDLAPDRWNGMGRVQRQRLFIQEKGLCFICGKRCVSNDFTVEHKISRMDGGTDDWENLAISHDWCNQKRGVADYERIKNGDTNPIPQGVEKVG